MTCDCFGLIFGDKGSISQQVSQERSDRGLKRIPPIRKTMRNRRMNLEEQLLVRKRSIIKRWHNPFRILRTPRFFRFVNHFAVFVKSWHSLQRFRYRENKGVRS